MYYFAFILLIVTMIASLAGIFLAVKTLWPQYLSIEKQREKEQPQISTHLFILTCIEYLCTLIALCLCIASGILVYALISYDFSLQYVASYTDRFLPLFYRVTAFWAGQAGSMLFWALSVSISGWIFQSLKSYKILSIETKLWFWIFYSGIMAFFGFVLITWNNPFIMLSIKPMDGNGLNPLLQNPGMIFHPPLLFLGYGGFSIPSCLALAQTMSHKNMIEKNWITVARPFILSAWAFLTAGILLGGWWAYMELGWGGYWAWDPVENASLIPWLISTAAIHTIIIQSRRNKLEKINVLLIALTTIAAFFATYVVRSGVVQSVHAFGVGGVGSPLLIFILLSTIIAIRISYLTQSVEKKELAGIDSREGFLILTSWILLTLAGIILLATMWPVFTSFWNENILGHPTTQSFNASGQHGGTVGLASDFYNRTCLPLFAALIGLLALCPWLGWNRGIHNLRKFLLVVTTLCTSAIIMYAIGYRLPVAVLGASSAFAIFVSTILLLMEKQIRRHKPMLAAYGIHFGVALIAMGIAFSGPYKTEIEPILSEGQTIKVGDFDVTLIKINEGELPDYAFIEGILDVHKQGKKLGTVAPQRRIYKKWGKMQFAEADTIPDLGNEFYASLLAVDKQNKALFKLSSTPLVNWIWIGGALMCLLPFISFAFNHKEKSDASSAISC